MNATGAFGLALQSSLSLPGLAPAPGERLPSRRCRLTLVSADEIERDWLPGESERVHEERFDDEPGIARMIDRHPQLGYRLYASHFGLARISADGTDVRCARPHMPDWLWERFLVGRILPIAAVLQGLEAIHASSVAWGERAVAIVAPSGVGKSSLALHLVLRGATLVTDDVVALEPSEDGVRAFPGPGVLGVRPDQRAAMQAALERGGKLLGRADKAYVEMPRASGALKLSALYLLRPTPAGTPASISPLTQIDPRALLSNTFVVWVRTAERLLMHLDVWARIAASIPRYEVTRPDGVDARALAELIEDHAVVAA